jgi:undecaprenyl-diphosphatase
MTYSSAVVLGVVQGLGEFLPISSSGHLELVPWLLGWPYQGKAVDVALHWGTLVAVCAYFWKDWARLIKAALSGEPSRERALFWSLVLATIPGGLVGLALEKRLAEVPPVWICAALAGFAVLLWLSDRLGKKEKGIADLDRRGCILIGCAQALAVLPGVSRSGITLTAALLLGLGREEAARFSFLLSLPIIVAAGLWESRHLAGQALSGPFWVGILVSAVTGLAAIRFLLAYLKERGVGIFVIYRLAFAAFCLFWAFR